MSRRNNSTRPRKASAEPPVRETRSRTRTIAAALALVVAGGLVIAAVVLTGGKDSDAGRGGDTTPVAAEGNEQFRALAKLARRDQHDPMALGSANAPVVMIEYSDFQCSFCRQFTQNTEPTLIEKYLDTGTLRIEWRNFPIFGTESEDAARAAWAAGQQGKFWEFRKAVYDSAPKKNTGALTPERLAGFAELAGVPDLARFRADQNSESARAALHTDANEGFDLGITATPAFLINGRPVLGAQQVEQFIALIEAARHSGEGLGK
ncbi:thioredoxin domain-containing protein [Nocardia sp. NPDC051463]|uniref:DsbA family protein n=1 Tax=Nocardia sp. NPDC051463 TaxID=3154845 RepID=UPI00343EF64E